MKTPSCTGQVAFLGIATLLLGGVSGEEVSSCRNGVLLTLVNELVSFDDAVQRCADREAVIAPSNTQEEFDQLNDLAAENFGQEVWIGKREVWPCLIGDYNFCS